MDHRNYRLNELELEIAALNEELAIVFGEVLTFGVDWSWGSDGQAALQVSIRQSWLRQETVAEFQRLFGDGPEIDGDILSKHVSPNQAATFIAQYVAVFLQVAEDGLHAEQGESLCPESKFVLLEAIENLLRCSVFATHAETDDSS